MMLADFIKAEAAKPYRLGSADCMTLAADWVALRRGIDPLATARGYTAGTVPCWASVVRTMGRELRRVGLRRTAEPRSGDVAAIATAAQVCAAIRMPRGWVMRLESGIALLPADRVRVVAAWGI